jgi:hypothetical protein
MEPCCRGSKLASFASLPDILNHGCKITGKQGFFDIGNAPADHGNRRTDLPGHAAWEIQPVMKLNVQ